jgi:hypothetical protein
MSGKSNGPQFRAAPLIISAAMIGAGTLVALAGLAIGGGHLITASGRWINEMEVQASDLAKLKWAEARAAYTAARRPGGTGSRTSVTSGS